jgi:PBP1b-binding outer membrane lipoprotein LpoB
MNADQKALHWPLSYPRLSAFICGLILFISGCTSAVQSGRNTALDGVDLVKMTDDMAMQIVASESVQNAITRDGQLEVVVEPVENRMRAEVLPRGHAEAFTARVRVLLARHAPDRFMWIMNRDAYYRLRERELDIDLGPAPDAVNPEYALTARFSSLADEHRKGRSSYYLCVFELTNLQTRTVLWSGSYEVKKTAVRTFLD